MRVKDIFSLIPKKVAFCTIKEAAMDDLEQPYFSSDLDIYPAILELENYKFEKYSILWCPSNTQKIEKCGVYFGIL